MTRAAVKIVSEDDASWTIEGLILPVGGPANGQDLTGSHFTKDTDYCLDWFPDGGRPGLYRHGFDPAIGASVVGREVKSWEDDKGRWLQAQIDKAHEYAGEIKQLLDKGLLSLSSGAVDHLVKIAAKSGEIITWPWVEWSMVPNPANPEALLYPVKSVDAIEHLGVLGIAVPDAIKSEAADDAIDATYTLGTLIRLLGDETDEAQAAKLRVAIDAITQFQAAEIAEIGTPEDVAETATEMVSAWMSADRGAVRAIPSIQSIHDVSMTLGAKCDGHSGDDDASEPAHVLAIRSGDDVATLSDSDLAAIRDELRLSATKAARLALGRPE